MGAERTPKDWGRSSEERKECDQRPGMEEETGFKEKTMTAARTERRR